MRYSKQREAVFDVLYASHEHPTVAMVYQEVRKTMPNISLGTVYRNLNELVQCGRAIRLAVDGCAERFDANTCNHAHFLCEVCKQVVDVPAPQLNCAVGNVRRAELTLYGVCEKCQKASLK